MKSEVAFAKVIAYYVGVLSAAQLLEVFSVLKGIYSGSGGSIIIKTHSPCGLP